MYQFSTRAKKADPVAINDWDLVTCKKAQEKYLAWIEKFPDHPDKEIKTHIYTQYLLSRIELLEREQAIHDSLNPPPTLQEMQQAVL